MNGTNPLAVVTGASSGIGFELAKQFAQHGYDLVIAAEDAAVDSAAVTLREYGTDVRTVRVDLATYDGVETLWGGLSAARRPVDALVLNAGVGQGGAFLETDLADEARIIDLNIASTVHLAKRVLPGMVARDRGRVLITSSIAATTPGSFQSVYNASKSFLQSFAQALQNELKDSAVTVTSLMPGPTETNFFRRAEMLDTKVGRARKDDPAQVAEQGYDALMAGRPKLVAGSLKTKAQGVANRVLSDRLKAAGHRRMAESRRGR
ncbi:SDR family NAD(P)-dependent oxidoreductase [Streptomyces sp. ISL-10]|uniref:SDR family NAD(P)-dependent oxidoreductase n=1 Tax=Streptomyces sp. ISL-10 TaxID=2819172 RepID=UPI001BE787EE|nr:SDR family NAD(P)-dependent oxidoreductase [Streptomyces sp. ISL-10]MBT2365893.1 SDR family NAD(P)-dependent oxidoreductase [Streptomyces sp. ISL-10]